MKKVTLAGLLILVFLTATAVAEPIRLKFATMDPAQAPPVVRAYQPWIDSINKASQGTLDIQIYPGGSLGRNPRIQLKLIKDGVADLGFIVQAYTPGQFPDDEVFNLPFMALNGYESAVASHRMFKKGLLRGYDDVVLLAHYTTEINYIHSTYPIRLPGDLKGHKFRSVNKLQNDIMKQFSAIGIGIPAPQIAENMSRGIIEATFVDNSALFTFRVADAAKYHLLVPFGSSSLAVVMNRQKYESLPPEAKAAFEKHGGDLVEMWISVIQGHVKSGMAKLAKDPSHHIIKPTPDELSTWKSACKPVIDEWTTSSPRRQMLVKAFQEELERIRSGH